MIARTKGCSQQLSRDPGWIDNLQEADFSGQIRFALPSIACQSLGHGEFIVRNSLILTENQRSVALPLPLVRRKGCCAPDSSNPFSELEHVLRAGCAISSLAGFNRRGFFSRFTRGGEGAFFTISY